jgi:hypothetical protein
MTTIARAGKSAQRNSSGATRYAKITGPEIHVLKHVLAHPV